MSYKKEHLCADCGRMVDHSHVLRVQRVRSREAPLRAALRLMLQNPVVLAEVVQRHHFEYAPLLEDERQRMLSEFHAKAERSRIARRRRSSTARSSTALEVWKPCTTILAASSAS